MAQSGLHRFESEALNRTLTSPLGTTSFNLLEVWTLLNVLKAFLKCFDITISLSKFLIKFIYLFD